MTEERSDKEMREAVPVEKAEERSIATRWRFDMMLVGFFLIALGGLLLASTMNDDLDLYELLATWWPLLIVAAGLVKIVQALTGISGKGSGLGWLVFLIIMLIVFAGLPWHYWGDDVDFRFFNFGFNKVVRTTTNTYPIEELTTLRVDARRSRVWIYGTDAEEVEVTERVIVRGWGGKNRESQAQDIEVGLTRDAGVMTIDADPTKTAGDSGRFIIELEVRVPRAMILDLRGEHTHFFARGIEGNVTAVNNSGDIELDSIAGAVNINSENGDVDLSDLRAGLIMRGSRLDVDLNDVSGVIDINIERAGLDIVNYRPIDGDISIRTTRGSIEAEFSAGSNFLFEGRSSSGKVYFDFRGTDVSERGEYKTTVGEGTYKVLLESTGGSVEVDES